MFGNKNSAVPYVRIGGVDRQSVLTSNANGNTPVKEIGVNANGNLIFSTDLATFKSVLDLKYSQFKSNDENQDDTWETEKSVSMRASGTLEDGTAKDTGVVVSKENVAMVNASMKDGTSTASQISVSNNDATIYSTNGTSTTQITVTPTGAKVNDKEIATTDKLPDTSKLVTTDTRQNITGVKVYGANINLKDNVAIIGWDFYGTNCELIKHYTPSGEVTGKIVVGSSNSSLYLSGESTRPSYGRKDYETGKELALLSDVPSVQQSTGTSTTATMSQNAITSAIPTKTSQLTNDSNFATTSQIPDISGKANLSGGNTFSGTQTFNNGITLANDTSITNASGNNVVTTQTGGNTIIGDPNGVTNIQGSSVRPLYTQNGSGSQTLALYKDIPNYFTTAGKTGSGTSGSLKLTAGHLYRIYVGNGDAQLACLVKMPKPMVEQYWFMGMNLYNHYCRLHISSAGIVTYQYANIGQTNWTDNTNVTIYYEDITSKN